MRHARRIDPAELRCADSRLIDKICAAHRKVGAFSRARRLGTALRHAQRRRRCESAPPAGRRSREV
jgi:hypothetical protein